MIASTLIVILTALAATSTRAAPSRKSATIECAPVDLRGSTSGLLRVSSSNPAIMAKQPQIPQIPQIPADGLVLTTSPGMQGDTILSGSTSHNRGLFEFYACRSSYMDYPSGPGPQSPIYGTLALAGNSMNGCVGLIPKRSGLQFVTVQACVSADNSLQLGQFWEMYIPSNKSEPIVLGFLGKRRYDTDAGSYSFNVATVDHKTVVQSQYIDGPYQSSYNLYLTPDY